MFISGALRITAQPPPTDHRFQTSPLSANALIIERRKRHMSDLTRPIRAAMNHAPTSQNARTDARTDLHDDQIIDISGNTKTMLSYSRQITVVADVHRYLKSLGQELGERDVIPGEIWCQMDNTSLAVHNAGCAYRNSEERTCGLNGYRLDQLADQFEQFSRGGAIHW